MSNEKMQLLKIITTVINLALTSIFFILFGLFILRVQIHEKHVLHVPKSKCSRNIRQLC